MEIVLTYSTSEANKYPSNVNNRTQMTNRPHTNGGIYRPTQEGGQMPLRHVVPS